MRIVSQDREYNLAFDQVHISTGRGIDGYTIVARDSFYGRPIILATYSTKEKCKAVFDAILVFCNSTKNRVITLPEEDEV